MEKEFVPYELAVKLKALGFDKPCFGFYQKSAVIGNDTILPLQIREEPSNFNDVEYSKMGVPFYSAPTFSQAFRWFKEKYGDYLLYSFGVIPHFTIIQNLIFEDPKITYEEAEVACLTKLIEIVENR